MDFTSTKIGFAITGSFCTFSKVIPEIKNLRENGADIYPIMSGIAYSTDTRFGKAEDFITEVENITQKKIWHTIPEVEPIGPKKLLDLLIIAPCTGNTISKIANGITDSPVALAAKSHMRNARPVLIAVSTNDGLGANSKNIGALLNTKNIFFVPFSQDDAYKKPTSLVADMGKITAAAQSALLGRQIQPLLCPV